ncbi:hypothetical protein VTN77DRAFT_130 [Rasamsonia byssochlamydoides]|uniref:uncharacterized protein n=1 Tax=Rasamsonia byssochlamydoides TaxID=89139 RepID=UPI003743AA5F
MEALGIRIRPPGLHPPVSSFYRPPRVYEQMFPSNNLANRPQPSSWASYGADVLPQYSLSGYQGGGSQFMFFPSTDGYPAGNNVKMPDETIGFSNPDSELRIFQGDLSHAGEQQAIPTSRKYPAESDSDLLSIDFSSVSGSHPGSSLSYSGSANPSADGTDLSGYNEPASRPSSEYTPRSSLTLSSTALSPVPSPRGPQSELPKAGNRLKASPSPRLSKRAAPYTLLDSARKRWSTGSYTSSPSRRPSPLMHQSSENMQQPPKTFRFSAPVIPSTNLLPSNFTNTPVLGSSPGRFYQRSFLLPSNSGSGGKIPTSVSTFPQGSIRTLQSNVDPGGYCFDPYANLSEPPDLLGPLREEPSAPPEKDMNPEDADLKPHEQELRFENDLYTPRWVRGHGNKREGWCGICKPGRWLVLKNSAFWYDKSFTHGVSAATGRAFEPPKETRRMKGNAEIWEGLCGSCGEWIPLVSSKKKGTTWFRHAYKCQNQSKSKDASKRRREVSRPSTARSSNKSTTSTSTTSGGTESLNPPCAISGMLGDRKTTSNLQAISSMI